LSARLSIARRRARSNRGTRERLPNVVFSALPSAPRLEARIYRAACARRRPEPIFTVIDVKI
jgi:hypothetical protein